MGVLIPAADNNDQTTKTKEKKGNGKRDFSSLFLAVLCLLLFSLLFDVAASFSLFGEDGAGFFFLSSFRADAEWVS